MNVVRILTPVDLPKNLAIPDIVRVGVYINLVVKDLKRMLIARQFYLAMLVQAAGRLAQVTHVSVVLKKELVLKNQFMKPLLQLPRH